MLSRFVALSVSLTLQSITIQINIDADWGWGYNWCGTRDPHDSRLTSFYCCGEMKMSELMGSRATTGFSQELYGRYLELFQRFLAEDFAQSCTIQSAVDQLLGPNGVLTDYLQDDGDFWKQRGGCRRCRNWNLQNEVRFM